MSWALLLLSACTGPEPEPAACPPAAPRPGEVRVRRLGCEADLPTGAFAAARVGDWVLENAVSRFVVRDGPAGHALVGLTGGNVVDAVRMYDGVQQGEDGLREYASAVGFHVLAPDAFTVSGDVLEVRGDLQPFPLVTDVLSVARPTAEVRLTHALHPHLPVLEQQVHLDGAEASVADIVLVRGGQQLFVPGSDPFDLPLTTDAPDFGVLTPDPALGSAVATSADVDRTLLYAGPIRVLLYAATEGTVTRRIALGADHAEASGWLAAAEGRPLDAWDNDAGLVEVRDADGLPLSRCRSEVCAVPDTAAELVPVWVGDGNGGPGGSDQEGPAARLRITAPLPFRASALRDDGLERFLLDLDGDAVFDLPPGDWDVWVNAGPVATQHTASVSLVAGEEVTIDADLRQVVDTTGWSAADLHVHMETSLDSDIDIAHRLRGAAVEGLDYLVTTDHDFVAEVPEALVPEGLILRTSAEVSTMTAGHYNAWPVPTDSGAAGNGAPDWRGLQPDALLDALPGWVQCNHPRFVDGGYAAVFEVGIAPERCDGVEVLNGFSATETPAVLDDLLGSWADGHRPVATGASDAHEGDAVGNPRTWIRATGDADTLDAALAAGHAVASGGPFVVLTLSDGASEAGVGDTLAASGPVTATVDLQAPDWMPLAELVLFADGVEVWTTDLSTVAAVDGLKSFTADVPLDAAIFVVAAHRGAPAAFPAIQAPPDVVTNPVWLAP